MFTMNTNFSLIFFRSRYSYGTVVGIGVGITRDCSTLMVAQYFKRRREFVEIFIVSGSGLGIAVMSIVIKTTIGYNPFIKRANCLNLCSV